MTTIHQHYGNDEHHNIEIEAQIWVKYFCFIPIPSVYVDSTCTYVRKASVDRGHNVKTSLLHKNVAFLHTLN